jgi:hypothetical protein
MNDFDDVVRRQDPAEVAKRPRKPRVQNLENRGRALNAASLLRVA